MKKCVLGLIKIYKAILSPIMGNHCRFYPTCSDYTAQAIQKHGLTKGLFLALKRLLRCHPFHSGGIDPVP
jgi:putative membrane protein insertion efficiency factor